MYPKGDGGGGGGSRFPYSHRVYKKHNVIITVTTSDLGLWSTRAAEVSGGAAVLCRATIVALLKRGEKSLKI